MAKTINIAYKGKDYTLEFNRNSVKALERSGFNIAEIASKPVSTIETLFHGALKMHHPAINREKAMDIYDTLNHKDELVSKVVELYGSVVEELTGAAEEAEVEGNANWDASF